MRIQKRTANKIRKFGYAKISDALELKGRQTVYGWYVTLMVPDKHIPNLEDVTGIEIK